MTKEELIERLDDIEWEDFEVKSARNELPKNIWESVSAFANCSGGWIVFGVAQNGKKFEIEGVENGEKIESDFLNTLRSGSKWNRQNPEVDGTYGKGCRVQQRDYIFHRDILSETVREYGARRHGGYR